MKDKRHSVAVIASHLMDCEAYRLLLQARAPYRVGYCCTLHPDSLAILGQSTPDLVLLIADVIDDAVRELLALRQPLCSRMLILVGAVHTDTSYNWSRAGADGVVTRADSVDELLTALEQLLAGGRYFSLRVRRGLSPLEDAHLLLSSRERSILDLLARGRNVHEVARELGVSWETVEKYSDLLASKLGAHDRAQLILLAIREHLVAC